MTRDEKIKRIQELENIKRQYNDALETIQGKENSSYYKMQHIGLVPKLMYMLGLKRIKEVEYDYSHNKADDELREIVEAFMKKKITECDSEIDSYLCPTEEAEERVW